MTKTINYISRKRLPQYHSIEGVFISIKLAIEADLTCNWIELEQSGASPLDLIHNLKSIERHKNTVYHITGDVHYVALKLGKQAVLTIHDVHSALKGSWFKRLYVYLFWFWLPALLVKKITVISEFTKQELEQLIPTFKHKIVVIPNPIHPNFVPSPKNFSGTPTILLMGTKPNKNLERVIKAVAQIPCTLHIIGVLTDAQLALLKLYPIRYTHRVNLSQTAIVAAYQTCDLLCFPSTYEGFGMPIIEAQATGRPVLTSNFGAMKEIAGDSAHFVDPYSVEDIRHGLIKMISDEAYRHELITKGYDNIKRFSTKHVTDQYMALYQSL